MSRVTFARMQVHGLALLVGLAMVGCTTVPNQGPGDPEQPGSQDGTVALKAPKIGLNAGEGEYAWTQTEGPQVALNTSDPENPTFIPKESEQETEYSFKVDVTVDEVTTTYEVDVTVPPATLALGNRPPAAVAGEFKIHRVGETVILNAGNSTDPDNDTLTFAWRQVPMVFGSGRAATQAPTVSLFNAETGNAGFLAELTGTYLFEVSVSDGFYTVTHTMAVAVLPGAGRCSDIACVPGFECDEATGTCVPSATPECTADTDCDDGFFCNGAERCVAGLCEPGEVPCDGDCDEDDDFCESDAECEADTDCDDGDLCTIDSCREGACGFEPVTCEAGSACNPASGECEVIPECEVDSDCADGEICNPNTETCEIMPECAVDADCPTGQDCDDGECVLAPADNPLVIAKWSNSSRNVNIDLDWKLPSGAWAEINRWGWSEQGAESVSPAVNEIADGLHWFTFSLDGSGRWTDVEFSVNFLGYRFKFTERMQGNKYRAIALDVQEGVAQVVFNGWLAAGTEGAGEPTGLHQVEIDAGWRAASNNVHVDVNMQMPRGESAEVQQRHGWKGQGFERLIIPEGIDLPDGTYQLNWFMDGSGRWADITYLVDFLGLPYAIEKRIQGLAFKTILIDVFEGEPYNVFNGWANQDDTDAGDLSPRTVQVTAGWRNVSNNIHVDINLHGPDGTYIPVWRNGWGSQGVERIIWPDGVSLEDGVYTLNFFMDGVGALGGHHFQARLLNWEFEVNERMVGLVNRPITLEVVGGIATELSNAWRD